MLGSETYRVECEVPELGRVDIAAEVVGGHIGGLADDEGGNGEGKVDTEARTRAGTSSNTVRDCDSNDLAAEKGKLVQPKGDVANLAPDVLHAVDGGGGDALGPDDKDERDIVGPEVDAVEEGVAKLGAVGQRQKQRQD